MSSISDATTATIPTTTTTTIPWIFTVVAVMIGMFVFSKMSMYFLKFLFHTFGPDISVSEAYEIPLNKSGKMEDVIHIVSLSLSYRVVDSSRLKMTEFLFWILFSVS